MSVKKDLFITTFENPFNIERFITFTKEFFNNIEIVRPDKYMDDGWNWSEFSFHVKGYYHIANFLGNDKSKIAVFAVEMKNHKNIDRSRSVQRNFIKKLMVSGGIDGAIVAFYAEGEGKWRLSFIKIDYEFAKGKVTEKMNPAKRYSYLVGDGEPCHTAMERLYPIFINEKTNPTIYDIEEAFSVERVTKEFFESYKEKYFLLKEHLDKNEDFVLEAERLNFTSEQFAKKLMGQLAFLYFIQKKGWLGVNAFPKNMTASEFKKAFYSRGKASRDVMPKAYRQTADDEYSRIGSVIEQLSIDEQEILAASVKGQPWGTGPKNFIRELFKVCHNSGSNFFDDYLEPLFYEALNEKRGANDYYHRLKCRVPFLNGGLFEPIDNYDWNHNDFKIPNEMFSNEHLVGKDDADGILDIFDRYNFTMNEDEPLEKEVAVDPEMLGKIFENLLDIKDRKSKGAFYTPREIVHYMCQESLINYLVNETGISYDALKDFIVFGEFMKDEDTNHLVKKGVFDMLISKEIFDRQNGVNRLKEIDEALANIKVADPAVGSGAFPLGMLSEIVKARRNITEYLAMLIENKMQVKMMYESERHPLNLKLHTIKNSIFAVDIEPSAVDITKLRLWLSLVVEQETDENAEDDGIFATSRNPRPLPNLDCNICCGNSLFDEIEGIRLINESDLFGNSDKKQIIMGQNQYDSLLLQLFEAQDKLFYERNHKTKDEIKKKISGIIDRIVMFNLHNAKIEIVEKYKKTKKDASPPYFLWHLNFAKVFKDKRGFDIVIGNPPYGAKFSRREKETLSRKYPTVPDFESADYFIDRVELLLKKNGIISYIIPNMFMSNMFATKYRSSLINNWSFIAIDNLSAIDVFESAKVRNCIIFFRKSSEDFQANLTKLTIENNNIVKLKSKPVSKSKLNDLIENWLNILEQSEEQMTILNKIKLHGSPLGDLADISQGLIPYDKYRGHSEEIIKNRVWHADTQIDETYKKELAGRDVDRYSVRWNRKSWISYGEWLAAPRKKEFFTSERILVREITNPRILAAYTKDEYYNTPSIINCINFKVDIRFVLGVLNSTLLSFYHKMSSPKANKGLFPKILVNDVRKLPINITDAAMQEKISNLVNEVLHRKEIDINSNTEELEKKIDILVYELYGLTEEEINTVEGV